MATNDFDKNNIFDVPFVSKDKAESKGDGYDICVIGKCVIENGLLLIFDADNFNTCDRKPLLVAAIKTFDQIKARLFKSQSGRYRGGKVELIGYLGNPYQEKIVLKMQEPEYRRMRLVLEAIASEQE